MTDNKDNQPVQAQKPNWLREVEEDAVYITNKRFAEAEEERKRDEEKAARDTKSDK